MDILEISRSKIPLPGQICNVFMLNLEYYLASCSHLLSTQLELTLLHSRQWRKQFAHGSTLLGR